MTSDSASNVAVPANFTSEPLIDKSNEASRVGTLDGLRGFAILAVVLFHLEFYVTSWGELVPRWSLIFIRNGWVGVDLFFSLSGFLITGILLRSRSHPVGTMMRSFYARRTLRIFPLYFSLIAFRYGFLPIINTRWILTQSEFWTQLSFTTNLLWAWRGAQVGGALAVAWSLSIEEQFYAVWPWVARAVSVRALRDICVAVVVASPLIRAAVWLCGVNREASYVMTPLRLDGLAAGAWLAIVIFTSDTDMRRRNTIALQVLVGAFGLFLLCVIYACYFPVANTTSRAIPIFPFQPVMYTIGFSATSIGFTALLYLALHPSSALKACLNSKFFVVTGRFSFSMYLSHLLIWDGLLLVFTRFQFFGLGAGLKSLGLFLIVGFSALFAFSALSWRFIEAPALRMRKLFPY